MPLKFRKGAKTEYNVSGFIPSTALAILKDGRTFLKHGIRICERPGAADFQLFVEPDTEGGYHLIMTGDIEGKLKKTVELTPDEEYSPITSITAEEYWCRHPEEEWRKIRPYSWNEAWRQARMGERPGRPEETTFSSTEKDGGLMEYKSTFTRYASI